MRVTPSCFGPFARFLFFALPRCTLLCGAAGLVACGTAPTPPLPQVAPAVWNQTVPSGQGPAPEIPTWWTSFNDRTLDKLVVRAMAENLPLAQARSRVRQARILAGRDNAQYLPRLGGGTRTVQNVPATDSFFQASLDAAWELGLFGARESVDRSAQARLDGAEAALHAANVSLVGEVVRSYIDLRSAQQQLAALRRVAALDTRAVELAEVRVRTHISAPGEREQARARQALTLALQIQPRQIAAHAAQGLATLLGQTAPDPAWLEPGAQPALRDFALTQLPADLLRFRPEIHQAEAEVRKASGDLGIARAELYPRVVIGASLVYSYNVTQNRPLTDGSIPVLGPLVDVPLFDWGRRRAAASARREALDASLLAYRQAVIEGVAETEVALATLGLQREREDQLQMGQDQLARRLQNQSTLVRLGLASELDCLTEERNTLQASLELISARASRALALVALYKALGGAPLPSLQTATASAAATTTAGVAR